MEYYFAYGFNYKWNRGFKIRFGGCFAKACESESLQMPANARLLSFCRALQIFLERDTKVCYTFRGGPGGRV